MIFTTQKKSSGYRAHALLIQQEYYNNNQSLGKANSSQHQETRYKQNNSSTKTMSTVFTSTIHITTLAST